MTCEICGKSQMNVGTYNIPNCVILDVCTGCLRKVYKVLDKYKVKATEEIQKLIEAPKDANR